MDNSGHMKAVSEQFRHAAGMPERHSDKPSDPLKAEELEIATEPEGGWGGGDTDEAKTSGEGYGAQVENELHETQPENAEALEQGVGDGKATAKKATAKKKS